MGPPPPVISGNTTTADTGLGNTTTESTVTTPSALTEEIVTPAASLTHIPEPVHVSVTTSRPTPSHNASLQNQPTVAPSMGPTLSAMGVEPMMGSWELWTTHKRLQLLKVISKMKCQDIFMV